MKDQYVILTGAKNNAGDFLIKHRAKALFAALRPDRSLLDLDAWKPFSEAELDEVNRSRALILLGGPALQAHMRPRVYPMVQNLADIQVPIILMGIGWKSGTGNWEDTHSYSLNAQTVELLKMVEQSGYLSSVRDYHTLNTLFSYGLKKFVMSGCPALYSMPHIGQPFVAPEEISEISFSLGVSFAENKHSMQALKRLILAVQAMFPHAAFTVVFHHTTDPAQYLRSYSAKSKLCDKQVELVQWLEEEKIGYLDISGGEELLIQHYSNCDLHIGYRVHAHIFMASISRPSILFAEDGRGMALKETIGGLVFSDIASRHLTGGKKIIDRLCFCLGQGRAKRQLQQDVIENVSYEIARGYPRIQSMRKNIDLHYPIMQQFICQLP